MNRFKMVLLVTGLISIIFVFIIFMLIKSEHEFDFIVVGGGTAGCVIAARLSESNEFKVLLLEAGGKPPFESTIPMLTPTMFNSKYDWNYTSIPQNNTGNKTINMIRGKMLGGTGSLNMMLTFRGNSYDYSLWQKSGAKHWTWESNLKFFKNIETNREQNIEKEFHGFNGPMCISNPGKGDPFIEAYLMEIDKMGYNYTDPNNGKQIGYSFAPLSLCNNERQSTYTSYLKPVMNRTNLKVETDAFVEEILFDNKIAAGVKYTKNGKTITVRSNKEVIVAGGAINSPQLLMLSGIGPKDHLLSKGIQVISDLPVGRNLKDHVTVIFKFTKPYENLYNNETLEQYFRGKGPLVNFNFGSAFIRSKFAINEFADIELPMSGFPLIFTDVKTPLEYLFVPIVLRPKSRGVIQLKSRNPTDYPLIDLSYLSDEYDLKLLTEVAKVAYNICKSMDVSKYGYEFQEPSNEKCKQFVKYSNEFWVCYAKNNADTLFHYSGTCAIGSVVDSKLRVIGVKGLRVADASVMPTISSSNTNGIVVMIGERASQFILRKHKPKVMSRFNK